MKGHSFSPLYWLSVHWALLDMVRQIGYPKIFWTLSPYEWSMPYHEWVRDEMSKALRSRLHLPVAETLHVTHVLYQTVKGLLVGTTGDKQKDPWQRHLLQAVDEEGCKCNIHAFMRLEFQDGTRKAATQDYHGSGRPHLHVLVFCTREALQNMNLDETLSATMPEKVDDADILPGIVEGSQLDRKGRSGWPIHEGCSGWDEEQDALVLAHTAEDHAKGPRPYFMDVMETLRCHQDLQVANDDGALRAYVTKCVSKFSDSNHQEWLNDSAEGNAIAATVLCRYKPLEPEMILQMFGASMRQWFVTTLSGASGTSLRPGKVTPLEVELYEKAEWAKGKISLLDFLRKTNKDGKVSAWMKKKQEEQGKWYMKLEDFAADYKMQGEKIVAAETLSRLKDKFFGQWLMLNVPFREPSDFYSHCADQLKLVPEQKDMKMEAMSKSHIQTVMGMIRSTRTLLDKYLTGELDLQKELAEREQLKEAASKLAAGADPLPEEPDFNAEQQRFMTRVNSAVQRSLTARTSNEDAADDLVEDAFKTGKIFVCHGGPGTGKTTVARACVTETLKLDGRVLFAYPTNRQASRMRAKLPNEVDVDTFHASFGLDSEPGACAAGISQYDLIVADKFSQMQCQHFEHIVKLWQAADNLPALVLLGDELQMGGYGEERPWHSRLWRDCTFRTNRGSNPRRPLRKQDL